MGSVLIRLLRNGFTMIDNVSAYMQVIRKQALWVTNWVNRGPSGQSNSYKDPIGHTCYVGRTTRKQLAEAQ